MTIKKFNGIDLPIPLIDLKAQYESIQNEIDEAIAQCINATDFIGGPQVKEFESSFANYLGSGQFVSCANGTDALEIILQAMDIGPGDEVIVPAFTWISTSEVVNSVGAKPIFIDILEHNACIDPALVMKEINSKTKAIICVHLYGQSAEVLQLKSICAEKNISLIEDCAQAHGSSIHDTKVGNFGVAAAFSFYPGKNLGAYGDGGGIYTLHKELADKCRMISNHGQKNKHHHLIQGRNSRLDTLQAAVLKVKLLYLDDWIQRKNQIAHLYNAKLSQINDLQVPVISKGHSFHLYVIQCSKRDELQAYLEKKGIQTAIHYPKALPFQEVYKSMGYSPEDFPVSRNWQNNALSLPMYPELDDQQINYIISSISEFFKT